MARLDGPGTIALDRELAASVGRALLESDAVGIIALDAHHRVTEVSAAAASILGRERQAALGRPLAEVLLPADDGAAFGRGGVRRLVGRRVERAVIGADGRPTPVELSALETQEGGEAITLILLRDVGPQRCLEERLAHSQALLTETEELTGAASFEASLRSGTVSWSDGIRRLLGRSGPKPPPSLEEAVALIHPHDRAAVEAAFAGVAAGRRSRFNERVRIARDGEGYRILEIRGKVTRAADGRPDRLFGTARDVTAELEGRRARDLLSYVVDSSDDAILTKSSDGLITSWNKGAERLYGYTAEEAVGRHISLIAPPGQAADQVELTARVFSGEAVHQLETTRVRKDGTEVAISLSVSPVRDDRGRIVSAAVVARDVTERRRNEERLRHLAEHDHLTGLVNRRRFDLELRRELARSARSGKGGAVISLDLDGFKQVNDTAGHAAGDAVLREVASALRRSVRASDTLARLGGDEFVVLVPEADGEQARAAAAHLLRTLHECVVSVEGTRFQINASLGVALFGSGAVTAEELMVDADLAMYEAKQQGRDRIVVFTHEQARAARADAKLSWGQRIRSALEGGGLTLHWQPIAEAASRRPTHGELLLRMWSGDKLLPPAQFLAAAERLGLIHAIDRWVLSRAIELLGTGRSPRGLPLSVNLSGESVAGDLDLLGLIERELARHGADPSSLILEITETAAIANIVEARNFVLGARQLGCRLALDDFGTGFGSFYHLKHLPVDFVKIDREFVHDLPDSSVDRRLVGSIVEVARSLGMRTVAEAVGSDATVRVLRELGVDYLQGYHVGEPVPVEREPSRRGG